MIQCYFREDKIKYWQDNHRVLFNSDARHMEELDDESIQMCVTSPPYWGLRKYSGEQGLVWDRENGCQHEWELKDKKNPLDRGGKGQFDGGAIGTNMGIEITMLPVTSGFCSLCGAWKGQLGLEPTPELYISHLVGIFQEVKRVLRKDGVCFLNIGDSYAGGGGNSSKYKSGPNGIDNRQNCRPNNVVTNRFDKWNSGTPRSIQVSHDTPKASYKGLKPKDLCLIPFRLAIALQEDGWWIRSDIIWSKNNPMPESVTDRPTNAHEHILMLAKSSQSQYWTHRDGSGARVKPKADYRWVNQLTSEEMDTPPDDWKVKIACPQCEATGRISVHLGLDVWQDKECDMCHGKKETQLWKRINLWRGHAYYWDAEAVREPIAYPEPRWGLNPKYDEQQGGLSKYNGSEHSGRNIRDVWEIPTQSFSGAHFATFPEKLVETCIKAATSEYGCCSKCGAPWARIAEKEVIERKDKYNSDKFIDWGMQKGRAGRIKIETLGFTPTCGCNGYELREGLTPEEIVLIEREVLTKNLPI